MKTLHNSILQITVVLFFIITSAAVNAADLTWDAGGSDNKWTTALNWSDDSAPGSGNDYFVNNATIESLGRSDNGTPRTYTFNGDSLSVTNSSKLYLRKKNTSGADYVTLQMPNLLIKDSTVESYSTDRNLYQTFAQSVEFQGSCTIYLSNGTYGNYLRFDSGMTGSGSIYVYRTSAGYGRQVILKSGDFSGYSGNWTMENTSNTEEMVLRIQTSSGWGSGDVILSTGGELMLEAAVNATNSTLNMSVSSAVLDLGSVASTVGALIVTNQVIDAGTYTTNDLTTITGGNVSFLGTGTLTVLPSLTVSSPHGTPDPAVGMEHYTSGASVTADVDASVTSGTTQYVCTGWTGSGSVAASGTTNSTTFSISTNSTINWLWTTNYNLNLTVGAGGSIDRSSGWVARGDTVTITATPDSGNGAVWSGDTTGCTITTNTISWTMNEPRSLTVSFPAIVTWDAGGSDDIWSTAANWDNDLAPSGTSPYLVDGASIQDPGDNDNVTPRTYTFGGDSLTLRNGATLFLKKKNTGGVDEIHEYISNLTIDNSTIRQRSFTRICRHYMENSVEICGDSTIYFQGGDYGSHLSMNDGMTGSGTLRVYRVATGSVGSGPDHQNSTRLLLAAGDFSGYSGDWTVESTAAGEVIYFRIDTTTGWGSGDVTLGESAYLDLNAAVSATGSMLKMTHSSAVLDLGSAASTVGSLIVTNQVIAAGTYTTNDLTTLTGGNVSFLGSGTLTVSPGGASLTVSSAQGTPGPAVGTNYYFSGDSITASVDASITSGTTQYVCTGWAGTGSVAASGTTNSTTFSISPNSAISWLWTTNYNLSLSVGAGGSIDRSSGWVANGDTVTITATADSGNGAVWSGDTSGCTITTNTISWTMNAARSLTVSFPAIVIWDAGAANDNWETALNWDNDLAPVGTSPYLVTNVSIESPGVYDSSVNATYTFGGDSLTIRDGAWLKLNKSNSSGTDYVNINIPNLTVKDANIHVYCYRNYDLTLNTRLRLEGDCEIKMGGELYQRWFRLKNGISGSGTVYLYYPGGGSYRNVYLESGDFSNYSGDWTVRSNDDTAYIELFCQTTSGWGTGDIELQRLAKLTFESAVTATNSILNISDSSAVLNLGSVASTVGSLIVTNQVIGAGTYTTNDLTTLTGGNISFLGTGTLSVSSDGASLTVSSPHGTPDPAVGTEYHFSDDSISAEVDASVTSGTTQYVCTGWAGTGSAPASGTTNSTAFSISENSTIDWLWTTNYNLSLSVGAGGSIDRSSGWVARGDVTITATPDSGNAVVWSGDTSGCTITTNTISWTMNEARSLTVSFPAAITWDAGGADDIWSTALNWDNDLAPSGTLPYIVDGVIIQDPGDSDNNTPRTYTFGGDSLTLRNGATLFLKKKNTGGVDYIYENIPNLTIDNSTIRQRSYSRICRHFMQNSVEFSGASTIYFQGGQYGSHLSMNDGMTGSGTLRVYRVATGSAGGGPGNQNSTRLLLAAGDFSGYSGDWLIESTAAGEIIYFRIDTATGWGSGNVTLGESAYLDLNSSITASDSVLTVSGSANKVDIGSGSHTVKSMTVGGKAIPTGIFASARLNYHSGTSLFIGTGTVTILEGPVNQSVFLFK